MGNGWLERQWKKQILTCVQMGVGRYSNNNWEWQESVRLNQFHLIYLSLQMFIHNEHTQEIMKTILMFEEKLNLMFISLEILIIKIWYLIVHGSCMNGTMLCFVDFPMPLLIRSQCVTVLTRQPIIIIPFTHYLKYPIPSALKSRWLLKDAMSCRSVIQYCTKTEWKINV